MRREVLKLMNKKKSFSNEKFTEIKFKIETMYKILYHLINAAVFSR